MAKALHVCDHPFVERFELRKARLLGFSGARCRLEFTEVKGVPPLSELIMNIVELGEDNVAFELDESAFSNEGGAGAGIDRRD